MKVTKEITFDTAHLLSFYDGKCANLHGHTYKLQVTLEGETNNGTCMLLDFNVLKEVLQEAVMNRFDHAVAFSDAMYRNNAEDELCAWAERNGMNFVVIPNGKTTCEAMAPFIRDCVLDSLQSRGISVTCVSVRLWETPTSFAEC